MEPLNDRELDQLLRQMGGAGGAAPLSAPG
jgi:hypothetical protein